MLSVFVVAIAATGFLSAHAQVRPELYTLQWPLSNSGASQLTQVGEHRFVEVPGTSGVDLEWINPAKIKLKKDILVAVIDGGIQKEHDEFEGLLWKRPNCSATEKLSCIGKNIIDPELDVDDENGHGTHVAGLIATASKRLQSTTPRGVRIMPLKVFGSSLTSYVYRRKLVSQYIAEAVDYAVENGADVINVSFGFGQFINVPQFGRAIEKAISSGVVVVAAAGNNGKYLPVFPCAFSGVLCVGAFDHTGRRPSFSNYGARVDLYAPGTSMISTYPTTLVSQSIGLSGYEYIQGTSQAAPLVSASVAILKGLYPDESSRKTMARLFASTVSLGGDEKAQGLYGRIRLKRAVENIPDVWIRPYWKDLLDVEVGSDLRFTWKLKLERLVGDVSSATISVEGDSGVHFDPGPYDVTFDDSGFGSIQVTGKIDSFARDFVALATVGIQSEGFQYRHQARVLFNRRQKFRSIDLSAAKIPASLLVNRRPWFSSSRLREGVSLVDNATFYHVPDPRRQRMFLLEFSKESVVSKQLRLKKDEQVEFVIRDDLDLDGSADFLVYSRFLGPESDSTGRPEMVHRLRYLNKDLSPLFENYQFELSSKRTVLRNSRRPILRLRQGRPTFSMGLFNDPSSGAIKVPVMRALGLLPDAQNTDDLLDYVSPEVSPKYYRLVPGESGKLVEEALLSVSNRDRIRALSGAFPWEDLRVEGLLAKSRPGNQVLLVSIGQDFQRRYFEWNWRFLSEVKVDRILAGNQIYSPLKKRGSDTVFHVATGRSGGRVSYWDGSALKSISFKTDGYSDPLFDFVGASLDDQGLVAYQESRFWLRALRVDRSSKIEINRESSFGNVLFSETIRPAVSLLNGKEVQSFFVNSVLLYGQKTYVIVDQGASLKRPIAFSALVPKNCAYLNPIRFSGESAHHLGLLCLEGRKAILKHFPLEL